MSEPADATTTSTPATPTPRTANWPRRLWLAGRILLTIGAVGYALSFWMWWWQVSGFDASAYPLGGSHYVLLLTPGDIVPAFGNEFYLHVLTVVGLLPLTLLWLSRTARFQEVAAVLVLAPVFLAEVPVSHPSLDYQGRTVNLIDSLKPQQLTIDGLTHAQIGWGLNLLASFVIVLGFGALAVAGWRTPADQRQKTTTRQPTRPRLKHLPAAGGLTLGLVIFLIGILGMGWTAVDCTERPLFFGQCTGLTFPEALHYGIASQTDRFDPIAALYAIPTLLVGGAILVVIGLWWWRRLTPGLALWITLYLATATFFFVVAYAGTGAIALHSGALGLQPGKVAATPTTAKVAT